MKKRKPKLLTFRDNKGREVKLADNLTMEDLVRMGIDIKMEPKGSPLPNNWYVHPPHAK